MRVAVVQGVVLQNSQILGDLQFGSADFLVRESTGWGN